MKKSFRTKSQDVTETPDAKAPEGTTGNSPETPDISAADYFLHAYAAAIPETIDPYPFTIGAITQIAIRSYDEETKLRDIRRALRIFYAADIVRVTKLGMSCEYSKLMLRRLIL